MLILMEKSKMHNQLLFCKWSNKNRCAWKVIDKEDRIDNDIWMQMNKVESEVRREIEDREAESHYVFLLTFIERWSAAASCQQDSLWGFTELLPGLKWFTGAEVCVSVFKLRENISLCVCAYTIYVRGKKGEIRAEKNTKNKVSWW